jgi:hypothetical protein
MARSDGSRREQMVLFLTPDGSQCEARQEPRRPARVFETQGSGGFFDPAVFDQRHAHHALIASVTKQFI